MAYKFWEIEDLILTENASKSKNSKRKYDEDFDDYESPYQVDKRRIIFSKAFRRLKSKTQVYISPEKDHYRTRSSHTLEVSSIARIMGRALQLNEDLVEAISLGHDLGHTPFGHMGEEVLNSLSPKGFAHYEQSVRVVEFIERIDPSYKGLNLTYDVIDGISNHTGDRLAKTLEGRIIKFADRISYINHDLEDAIRACIIEEEEVPLEIREIIGSNRKERLENMMKDLIYNSSREAISMSEAMYDGMMTMRKFLFDHVYYNDFVTKEKDHVYHVLSHLYRHYLKNINDIPSSHLNLYKDGFDSREQIIIDYLSGMTDNYILLIYENIFIPKRWKF